MLKLFVLTGVVFASQLLAFVRGPVFIRIIATAPADKSEVALMELARVLAAPLDRGEGDVPVLLKHLPDWQTAQAKSVYAVNASAFKGVIENQPVLSELN